MGQGISTLIWRWPSVPKPFIPYYRKLPMELQIMVLEYVCVNYFEAQIINVDRTIAKGFLLTNRNKLRKKDPRFLTQDLADAFPEVELFVDDYLKFFPRPYDVSRDPPHMDYFGQCLGQPIFWKKDIFRLPDDLHTFAQLESRATPTEASSVMGHVMSYKCMVNMTNLEEAMMWGMPNSSLPRHLRSSDMRLPDIFTSLCQFDELIILVDIEECAISGKKNTPTKIRWRPLDHLPWNKLKYIRRKAQVMQWVDEGPLAPVLEEAGMSPLAAARCAKLQLDWKELIAWQSIDRSRAVVADPPNRQTRPQWSNLNYVRLGFAFVPER